jgi:hypothetical protein
LEAGVALDVPAGLYAAFGDTDAGPMFLPILRP